MLPKKIKVTWPFGSGEEAKNRFLRRLPQRHGFRIGAILAIFDLQVTPKQCFLPSFKSVGLSVQAKNTF